MHNYMRMYWGKKVLEWTRTPKTAFRTLLYLNNRYFLDGRDPNSYAGVGWIFGVHDRAWPERAVYGKVRCMMASGLERKFDISKYVERIQSLKI
jgi:deoxyribodipyrimidine photo-lyase